MTRYNKCQSKNPSTCPYHGNAHKMYLAVENKDIEAYFVAKAAENEAHKDNAIMADSLRPAFDKFSDIKIASITVISDGFTNKDGVEEGWVEVFTKISPIGFSTNEAKFYIRKTDSDIQVYKNAKTATPLTEEEIQKRFDKSEKNMLLKLKRFDEASNIII